MYKQAYYFYFEVEKVAEEEKNREPESDVESDKEKTRGEEDVNVNDDELEYLDPSMLKTVVEAPPTSGTEDDQDDSEEEYEGFEVDVDGEVEEPWFHTQAVPNSYLAKLNLTATNYRLLVCNPCGRAHVVENMLGHMRRTHQKEYAQITSSWTEWKAVVQECNILDVMPPVPNNTPPPLYGLTIMKGFKCAYCNRCAMDKHSLRQHSCDRPNNEATNTYMQQFNNNDSRTWFPVQPPPPVDNEALEPEVQAMITEFLEYKYEAPAIDDPRMLSPWNMSTKWPIYTKGFTLDFIHKAVAADKTGEYKQLKDKLREYLRRAEAYIESTNRLVLQRLNTDDPNVCGIDNQTFSKHQAKATLDQYSTPIYCFLLMLLRNHDDDHNERQLDIGWVAKDDDLYDALTTLKWYFWEDGLKDEDERLIGAIHQALYRLWAYSYTSTIDDPIPDPTERYLMLQSVGADGAFMEPHNITPIIAKFKYVLRLTMIYELHNPTVIEKRDNVHELSAQIVP
ncbi:hypothetical protein BC629DRAFT_1596625, partial [Irpex lacteus]